MSSLIEEEKEISYGHLNISLQIESINDWLLQACTWMALIKQLSLRFSMLVMLERYINLSWLMRDGAERM